MNIILMDIYDEYFQRKTINKLLDFAKLTFPQDGTDKLFIACTLILINNVYKTRLNSETLRTVVLALKEKIGDTNLLRIYLERINDNKLISKYLTKVIDDENVEKYADLILEYLDDMSFDFSRIIHQRYQDKINEYN